MENLCRLFQTNHLHVPLFVGGATTSAVHTAVKLAPLYDGCVAYGGDASQTSVLAKKLQIDPKTTISQLKAEQQQIRDAYNEHHAELTPYTEANAKAPRLHDDGYSPVLDELRSRIPDTEVSISTVSEWIDWRMFLLFWGFKGETLQQLLVNPEAEKTLADGKRWLQQAIKSDSIQLMTALEFEDVTRNGNDLVFSDGQSLPMLRSQSAAGRYLSLADFYDDQQPRPLGLFVVVARPKQAATDDTERLMAHAVCSRLAEACAEWLQQRLYGQQRAIRAAFGYASCPDHSLKRIVFDRLQAEQRLGVSLTDHYSILPSTSICGMFIGHSEARYFPIGHIDRAQLTDYCQRRGITLDQGEQLLSKYINNDNK